MNNFDWLLYFSVNLSIWKARADGIGLTNSRGIMIKCLTKSDKLKQSALSNFKMPAWLNNQKILWKALKWTFIYTLRVFQTLKKHEESVLTRSKGSLNFGLKIQNLTLCGKFRGRFYCGSFKRLEVLIPMSQATVFRPLLDQLLPPKVQPVGIACFYLSHFGKIVSKRLVLLTIISLK